MIIETDDDLVKLREIGIICRDTLHAMHAAVRPGITPLELDNIAKSHFAMHGARSAPIVAYNFPGETCISVGDAIAHGIPNDIPLIEGQLINIDVSAEKDGYFGDTGASAVIGQGNLAQKKLLEYTHKAQNVAMMACHTGQPINSVGKMVEKIAEKGGYKIIAGLSGHGVGRWIHEDPTIPNVYHRKLNEKFKKGQVITIEPFLTTHSNNYVEDLDGWTLRLEMGGMGAQFEHTFVITDGAPIIITG